MLGKKGESKTFTTSMPDSKSILMFVVVILLIIGLFFIVKTYSDLSGETIIVESEQDALDARGIIEDNLNQLDEETEDLLYLASES